MRLETLLDKILSVNLNRWGTFTHEPCSEDMITVAELDFFKKLGVFFPQAYKRILRCTNGLLYKELIILPITNSPLFEKTILEVNLALRATLFKNFIYYGQWNEQFLVYNLNRRTYGMIEDYRNFYFREYISSEALFLRLLEKVCQ